jgi:hypothetical protein
MNSLPDVGVGDDGADNSLLLLLNVKRICRYFSGRDHIVENKTC